MNLPTYAIPFDTEDELREIVRILKKHNSNDVHPEFYRYNESDEFTQLTSGEALYNAATFKMKKGKAYKTPFQGPSLTNVLLCESYEAHQNTIQFLLWELRKALPDVWVDGFHAIKPYSVTEALMTRVIKASETKVSIEPEAVDGRAGRVIAEPAIYVTRVSKTNPAFMDMPIEERRKKVGRMAVVPYLLTFESVTKGFVADEYVFEDRAEAEAKARELSAEHGAVEGPVGVAGAKRKRE